MRKVVRPHYRYSVVKERNYHTKSNMRDAGRVTSHINLNVTDMKHQHGAQGWRSGSIPARCHMRVEFGSGLDTKGFLPVLLFSSLHKKTNTPNSNYS